MDWVWIVGLTWLALALPIALLVGVWIQRTDLRDAGGRHTRPPDGEAPDDEGRGAPRPDRPAAGPVPPASGQHRPHRPHGRRRALHCPECRGAGARLQRRAPGPPEAAAGG